MSSASRETKSMPLFLVIYSASILQNKLGMKGCKNVSEHSDTTKASASLTTSANAFANGTHGVFVYTTSGWHRWVPATERHTVFGDSTSYVVGLPVYKFYADLYISTRSSCKYIPHFLFRNKKSLHFTQWKCRLLSTNFSLRRSGAKQDPDGYNSAMLFREALQNAPRTLPRCSSNTD